MLCLVCLKVYKYSHICKTAADGDCADGDTFIPLRLLKKDLFFFFLNDEFLRTPFPQAVQILQPLKISPYPV